MWRDSQISSLFLWHRHLDNIFNTQPKCWWYWRMRINLLLVLKFCNRNLIEPGIALILINESVTAHVFLRNDEMRFRFYSLIIFNKNFCKCFFSSIVSVSKKNLNHIPSKNVFRQKVKLSAVYKTNKRAKNASRILIH